MTYDPNSIEEKLCEPIQDYLDTLLSRATEQPETQLIDQLISKKEASRTTEATTTVTDTTSKLTELTSSVDSTESLISSRPNNRHGDSRKKAHSKPVDVHHIELSVKPYAEPLSPITLKSLLFQSDRAAATKNNIPVVTPISATSSVSKTLTESAKEIIREPIVDLAVTPKIKSANTISKVNSQTSNSVTTSVNQPAKFQPSQWLDNGRPNWAQKNFECLIFSVGGLKLAVPLVELGSIYSLDYPLTRLFGQVEWFMGLLRIKEGNLRTIDTAKVVMPERYQPEMTDKYHYVISINKMDWGLAVDNVTTTIVLEPEQIKWRSRRSKRPWLAGTVIEQMCSLIDVSQLAAIFESQDVNS